MSQNIKRGFDENAGLLNSNPAAPGVSWGLTVLDQLTRGLVKRELNILECNDFHAATITLGRYIHAGLKNGETAAFVVFDSPNAMIKNFQAWNIDLESYIRSEQLFVLSLQSRVLLQASQRCDFAKFYNEIENLCRGQFPDRIAIQGLDYLFDLSSPNLVHRGVAEFCVETLQRTKHVSTMLGSFVHFKNAPYQEFAIALQKLATAYFSLQHEDTLKNQAYERAYWFLTRKIPWFNFHKPRALLQLEEGVGLVEKVA